jgi:peptidoglycan/xylan/chitin deacetylase (PgdA/CDA1 family)
MSKGSRSLAGVVCSALLVAGAAGCGSEDASGDTAPQLPGRVTVPPEVTPSTTSTAPTTTTTTRPDSPYADRLPHFPAPPPPQPMVMAPDAPAPVLSRIETDQPVAFITIDDGYVRHPEALQLIRDSGVPVTLFLISSVAAEDPEWFGGIRDQADAVIEAHTVTHARLRGLSYDAQRKEICGSADQLEQMYGTRPTLFRAPGGLKDATTQQVAHDCGFKAIFFWKEAVNDGHVQFQEGTVIHPGDVILMHFRQTFVEDYLALLQGIEQSGLTPARLEDYIA